VHGIKAYKDKYTLYHSKWKQRRASKWKNPFEVPDTPTTVLKEVVVGNGKTADGEMKIDFRLPVLAAISPLKSQMGGSGIDRAKCK